MNRTTATKPKTVWYKGIEVELERDHLRNVNKALLEACRKALEAINNMPSDTTGIINHLEEALNATQR